MHTRSDRSLRARFSEHNRYIRTNNSKSVNALHGLNSRHENGSIQ